jgi:hypothetical protein
MNQADQDPITLVKLNKLLTEEAKRLVREKEDGIAKFISKKANLTGNSTMTFKKKDGAEVTLSFRLNENNNLRIAFEDRFLNK